MEREGAMGLLFFLVCWGDLNLGVDGSKASWVMTLKAPIKRSHPQVFLEIHDDNRGHGVISRDNFEDKKQVMRCLLLKFSCQGGMAPSLCLPYFQFACFFCLYVFSLLEAPVQRHA